MRAPAASHRRGEHRHQPALRPEVLDQGSVRAGQRSSSAARSSATNSCAASGPPPSRSAAHERAPDDHAVGVLATPRPPARRSRCPTPEQHRLVGDRLAAGGPSRAAWLASEVALARDAHAATRRRRSRASARRWRRSRSSGVVGAARSTVSTPWASAASAHAVELVEREVGQDRRGDAGVAQRGGEAPVAHVADRVGVGHHHERHVDVELRRRRRSRRVRRRAVIGAPAATPPGW